MSDKDRIKQLFADLKIPYTEGSDGANVITLEPTGHSSDDIDRVIGYSGFYCDFMFNDRDALKYIGIWE